MSQPGSQPGMQSRLPATHRLEAPGPAHEGCRAPEIFKLCDHATTRSPT